MRWLTYYIVFLQCYFELVLFLFVIISVKFLEFVKPFCAVLPEIQKPERKVCLYLEIQ